MILVLLIIIVGMHNSFYSLISCNIYGTLIVKIGHKVALQ